MLLAMPEFLPSVVCSVSLPNRRRQVPAPQAPPLDPPPTFSVYGRSFAKKITSSSDLYLTHIFIYPKR